MILLVLKVYSGRRRGSRELRVHLLPKRRASTGLPQHEERGNKEIEKKKEREESTSESRTQFMADPHNIYATAVSERLTPGRVGTRVRVRGLEAPVPPRMRRTWCSKHHV